MSEINPHPLPAKSVKQSYAGNGVITVIESRQDQSFNNPGIGYERDFILSLGKFAKRPNAEVLHTVESLGILKYRGNGLYRNNFPVTRNDKPKTTQQHIKVVESHRVPCTQRLNHQRLVRYLIPITTSDSVTDNKYFVFPENTINLQNNISIQNSGPSTLHCDESNYCQDNAQPISVRVTVRPHNRSFVMGNHARKLANLRNVNIEKPPSNRMSISTPELFS